MENLIDLSQENANIDAEFDATPPTQIVPSGANGNTKNGTENACYQYVLTISCAKCASTSDLYDILDSNCKKFVFQKEQGENGYQHYQIACSFHEKMRIAQVKQVFAGLQPHIEKMKHVISAWQYAQKHETRMEGPWDKNRRPIKIIAQLRTWQANLRNLLEEEPNERTVNWYYDLVGGTGKTTFCKYLVATKNARYFNNNRTADVAFAWHGEKIVLFDFSRSNRESINYGIIESIKNGILFSGKYESRQKVYDCPHVVCFANYLPDITKLSEDRWNIVEIQINYGFLAA